MERAFKYKIGNVVRCLELGKDTFTVVERDIIGDGPYYLLLNEDDRLWVPEADLMGVSDDS